VVETKLEKLRTLKSKVTNAIEEVLEAEEDEDLVHEFCRHHYPLVDGTSVSRLGEWPSLGIVG